MKRRRCNIWGFAALLLLLSVVFPSWSSATEPQAAWVPKGPYGGDVFFVKIAKATATTPQTIFASTTAGVFKSADNGANWTHAGFFAYSLVIDPVDPKIMYAESWNGVSKSMDSGNSWTLFKGIDPNNFDLCGVSVAVTASTPTTAYVGICAEAVYRKAGDGQWETLMGQNDNIVWDLRKMVVDPANSENVYYATSTALYKKSSAGVTLLRNDYIQGIEATRDGTSPNGILYVNISGSGLYRVTNGGQNWSLLKQGYITSFAVSEDNSTIFTADSQFLSKSTDGGVSWQAVWTAPYQAIQSIAIDPTNSSSAFLGMRPDGVFNNNSGTSSVWTPVNNGLNALTITSVAVNPDNYDELYASTNSYFNGSPLHRLTNNGWVKEPGTFPNYGYYPKIIANYAPPSIFMANVELNKKDRSDNVWEKVSSNITDIAVDPSNPSIVYGVNAYNYYTGYATTIFRSSVYGNANTWVPDTLGPSINPYFNFYKIAVAKNGAVYAAGWDSDDYDFMGSIYRQGLYKRVTASDNSTRWEFIPATNGTWFYALALSPSDPLKMYASNGGGLIVSTNGGNSWSSVANAPTGINSIVIDPNHPDSIFVAGNGISRTTDGGLTWAALNTGLPSGVSVTSLALNPAGTMLHAGTGRGVYQTAIDLVQVSLQTSGSGAGSISYVKDSVTKTCNGDNSDSCNPRYYSTTSGIYTANPAVGSVFDRWEVPAGVDRVNGSPNNELWVELSHSFAITAVFKKIYDLGITIDGAGKVSYSATAGPTGTCPDNSCSPGYVDGSSITLTAIPNAGSYFDHWEGCEMANGSSCTVNLTAAKNVRAVFRLQTFTLSLNTGGEGSGKINYNTNSQTYDSCPVHCGPTYSYGATVQLTAVADPGSVFDGWTDCDSTTEVCSFAIASPATVTARFARVYSLSASVYGTGGTVSPDAATVRSGESYTFQIGESAGYKVASLTDNGQAVPYEMLVPAVSGGYSYTISNVNASHTLVVTFMQKLDVLSSPITALAADTATASPTTKATLYAGTANGIFKSTDNGIHWENISTVGLTNVEVKALAVDTTLTPANIYIATGDGVFSKRVNEPEWRVIIAPHSSIKSIAVDTSTIPATVYVGTANQDLIILNQ